MASSMHIKDELESLISANIKPGQYMFSDHFKLEDTLPAIDIGNTKMDRGMIRIEEETLIDFVDLYFRNLSDKQIDISDLVRRLFRLEMTWYTGRAYFSDTLLTCILLHRDPSVVAACSNSNGNNNRLVSLVLEATMTAASLMNYLIASSPVIRDEDFHANLYGMNWWASTYAGGHLPRFNPQTRELIGNSGEVRLQNLLDQLVQVCRQEQDSKDKFYFARLYYWIRFLSDLIKATSITSQFGSILSFISDLQHSLGDPEDDEILGISDEVIYPQLANLFGTGCVRPEKPILSLNCSIRSWNRMVRDDLQVFLGQAILQVRPRFMGLVRLLSERSRDPLKPPMLPITRAIVYASLVQSRMSTIYQIEDRDLFSSSSLPAAVSLVKLPDLPLLLQDFIQVYCCNTARQRRFLPDLISFWDERILGQKGDGQMAGYRSVCWMTHLRDLLALDLILLYGHLKLLDPFEETQAAHLIHLLFEKFRQEGKEEIIRRINTSSNRNNNNNNFLQIKDQKRWNQRWSLISKPLNVNFEEENLFITVDLSPFNSWYKMILKFGSTAFSIPEPDWQDDSFCTPITESKIVGTLFTMFTTEPDRIEVESDGSDNILDGLENSL